MSQTYPGSCHCRRVTFEVKGTISDTTECNCSICRRIGALWHGAAEGDVRILAGESELVPYQFNTMVAKHYFCKHCGIHPLSRPRLDPRMWVVNVRCLEGVDLAALPVRQFDGVNWEASAKALMEKLRRQPPS
jgi:hypothetical protein